MEIILSSEVSSLLVAIEKGFSALTSKNCLYFETIHTTFTLKKEEIFDSASYLAFHTFHSMHENANDSSTTGNWKTEYVVGLNDLRILMVNSYFKSE